MSTFDTAGEPRSGEPGTERLDAGAGSTGVDGAYSSGLVEAAEAGETVTNDAVAGETVYPGTDGLPTTREAAPETDELVPANDGYLAPANQTGDEDIDLADETDDIREVEVTHSEADPDAFSAGLHP